MTITCPRCGLAFETQATTNTRCRRCKTVVRIGSGRAGQSSRAGGPAPEEPSAELAGSGLVVIAAGVVIVAFYVVPAIVRFVRRRADRAPTSGAAGPGTATLPPPATAGRASEAGAHMGPL